MSKILRNEIDDIKIRIQGLTSLVKKSVEDSIKSLQNKDLALAKEVIALDSEIDQQEVAIEEECLKILALHQPVAYDLRMMIAFLKINNDLERIGDLSTNIAERAEKLISNADLELPSPLSEMFDKVLNMLDQSIIALMEMNSKIAVEVLQADDEVDDLNRDIYLWAIENIKKSPDSAESYILLLSVSRHLERIADLASNIAEDVIYTLEGEIIRHGGQ